MKKLHLSLLFSLAFLAASSQKVYFVYIQTESDQPFYVKMNEKLNSSTASGYIILSKLVDSTYHFSIGFPQNKWPEQNFSVAINKKDHGYLLKNFGEKGWGLFDLQTLTIQMAVSGKASIDVPRIENNNVSSFTEILSKAADDPSLRDKPVRVIEEKKTEVAVEAVKKEETKEAVMAAVQTGPLVEKKEEPKTGIKEAATKPVEVAVIKEETKEPVAIAAVQVTEVPVEKKEEPKTEVKEAPTKPVEIAEIKKEESNPVITEQPVTNTEEPYKMTKVKKWSESSTTEGLGLVFIDDDSKGSKDTIRLVIPNPNPAVSLAKEEVKDDKSFIKTSELPAREEEKKEKKETIVQSSNTPETPAAIKPTVTEAPAVVVAEKPIANDPAELTKSIAVTTCRDVANGDDFVKLRRRMAAAESDDDMIAEAKKYYKTKCFSTWQMKNLAVLFLTDEGKYRFFDASYPYVTDAPAFASLQAELKDEYYAGRFKAMLRN